MLSIAYVSAATGPVSDEQIADILQVARRNNGRDGLTGALIYHGGRFIQILEGPDERVNFWYDIIEADPRHRILQKVREKQISERQFPDWTMGFRAPSGAATTQLEGFEDFFGRTGLARIEHAENEAQQFLEWLGEYWLPKR
jgi:hypothetical protein